MHARTNIWPHNRFISSLGCTWNTFFDLLVRKTVQRHMAGMSWWQDKIPAQKWKKNVSELFEQWATMLEMMSLNSSLSKYKERLWPSRIRGNVCSEMNFAANIIMAVLYHQWQWYMQIERRPLSNTSRRAYSLPGISLLSLSVLQYMITQT
jgi:hypothetical protein